MSLGTVLNYREEWRFFHRSNNVCAIEVHVRVGCDTHIVDSHFVTMVFDGWMVGGGGIQIDPILGNNSPALLSNP